MALYFGIAYKRHLVCWGLRILASPLPVLPEVPLPARHEALAHVQDSRDVILLDAMRLHGVEEPDALGEALLLVEVALGSLLEELFDVPPPFRLDTLKILLHFGLGAAREAFVFLGLWRSWWCGG